MKNILQKLLCLSLVALITVFCALPASAETLNITTEITKVRNYYIEQNRNSQTFIENIAFAATGVFDYTSAEPFTSDESTVYGIAANVATEIAVNGKVDESRIASLISAQNDDGSFGSLEETVLSVIALKCAAGVFSSQEAVANILSYQNEDGSFGTGDENSLIYETANAIVAITMFSTDTVVASAVEKALNFLRSSQLETGLFGDGSVKTLSAVIMAVSDSGELPNSDEWKKLFTVLSSFAKEDGSYSMYSEGESDAEATANALCALHTLGRNSSPYRQLMSDGKFSGVELSDYLPFITIYAVIALLAVVFWIFILKRKPSDKTLKETKEYYL